MIAREATFIESAYPDRIEAAVSEIEKVRFGILMRMPNFLIGMFQNLIDSSHTMNDQLQARQFIEAGRKSIKDQDWDELRRGNERLMSLLPEDERESAALRPYTGIV